MTKSWSVTTKLSVLLLFALIFGAAMIALSVKRNQSDDDGTYLGDDTKRIEKKFPVQLNGSLVIDTDLGDVSVTGCDVNELTVLVTERASHDILRKFHLNFEQQGNTVRIEGRYPQRLFRFFEEFSFDVRYVVQVPREFNLDIETAGGNLMIKDVKGDIRGNTSGGDVDVAQLNGKVRVTTSGGNVNVRKSNGDLLLKTSGGDIEGDSIDGTIDVETSGGNIVIKDSEAKLKGSTSGGDIRVELKNNNGIDLSTSGGNISVTLPPSIAAQVVATTTGGDVHCDYALKGEIKEGDMRGEINGGGNLIHPETSGGDISIHSLE